MESAIPEHLRCPRTQARRAPEGYAPPYPAWVARLSRAATQVVMAYFGVQYRDDDGSRIARAAVERLSAHFAADDGPGHHDVAHYTDESGFDTLIVIAYWDDPTRFAHWLRTPSLDRWWHDDARQREGVGYFREIVCPRVAHVETLFSTPDRFEGVAVLAPARSDEIVEHGYWGGARDRLPLAQIDALLPGHSPVRIASRPDDAQRVLVRPQQHLALIRSGQEWTDTEGQERALYLDEVEPVLRRGMDYLRDEGLRIGCYANRYMRHVDAAGQPMQKSFGMSYWRSLGDLEAWAESHATHVAIFGSFMRMVQAMNFQLRLRLYHEVTVAKEDEQWFEYVNCHPKTGMLRCVS
jgi:aldoxime dehydratase